MVLYGLIEDEEAFDILYCIAFELMDAQWLAMEASYMQFKVN
jgi:ELMO domain-containing protein